MTEISKSNSELKVALNNMCRCCLAKDWYKDISVEYYFCGEKEVYEDMLKDTFDIQISYYNSSGKFICENCITKLRDAHAFKQMVMKSTEYITKHLEGFCDNKDVNTDLNLEIKIEPTQDFVSDTHDDETGSLDDDEILANIKLEMAREYDKSMRTHRKATTSKMAAKKHKMKDKDNQNEKSKKDWLKIVERRGNGPILRQNSLKLIENSTMCVFQWNKSRYRCFCCKEPFCDMATLKKHTDNTHTLEDIEKKIIFQQNRLVKVDITVLKCKICDSSIENIDSLRDHLGASHGISFGLKEDLLVPFKIQNGTLQCQICSENFTVFRLLNIHMNKHYQKQVCHICGEGFSNLVFLNLHKTRSHKPLSCKQCGLVFGSKIEKRNHDTSAHNLKIERRLRFPCPYCPERFCQENSRVLHLVEKHGLPRPEHKCIMCSKVFITKSLCNNHVKLVHLKQKNKQCDICHNVFYTKHDVKRHRVTHTGEKNFSCALCNNSFATKDSLRRHNKRTHAGIN